MTKLKSLPNFPKMKVINEYNLSPQLDLPNDSEVRRQGYNHALSEVGELECPSVPSVRDIVKVIESMCLIRKAKEGKKIIRYGNIGNVERVAQAIHNLITKQEGGE